MDQLPAQQRKIVAFLSERRYAVSVKEIARECRLTPQAASTQLQRLREISYVHPEAVGRESFYELREPLMRFVVELKKERGRPVQLTVDFLRRWYTHDELEGRPAVFPIYSRLEGEYIREASSRSQYHPGASLDDEQLKQRIYSGIYSEALHLIKQYFANTLDDPAVEIGRAWRTEIIKQRFDEWQAVTQDDSGFEIPARLLDAAARWRKARDQRILLGLPVEERRILEELLPKEGTKAAE